MPIVEAASENQRGRITTPSRCDANRAATAAVMAQSSTTAQSDWRVAMARSPVVTASTVTPNRMMLARPSAPPGVSNETTIDEPVTTPDIHQLMSAASASEPSNTALRNGVRPARWPTTMPSMAINPQVT